MKTQTDKSAWCCFFPVGRFWILQKLGQIGLIDASFLHGSLTCWLSVMIYSTKITPIQASHPWDPGVC